MKVMTIVGTRPEVIKLSRVIHELDTRLEHVLVHTGQNYDYELNEVFFTEMAIRRPDHFLEVGGGTVAEAIGNVIARADAVLAQESPDALLLLGDTNSCLAVIAAKRRRIPVFHMEAGNRCFDERVPEEINRRIVDHISDINLPYTEHARRYLLAEGLDPATVIKTGSPMKEVLTYHAEQIHDSDVLERLALKADEYFLVSAHREENVDSPRNFSDFLASLNALAAEHGQPVIVSTHPRTRNRLEASTDREMHGLIRFLPPMGFFDYVKLETYAKCVVSDSGTITEESAILGFPAVTIRQAHERPEGMDEGTLVMCGLQSESVLEAIRIIRAQRAEKSGGFRIPADYDVDNVSAKVVRIILSYVEYVNRTVWFKGYNGVS